MPPLKDLVLKNRSYRRFHEDQDITKEQLKELLELARFSASGANKQPLKFLFSCSRETNNKIFPNLGWAGYLPDWDGPKEGERPTAYIVILGDTTISTNYFVDHGIMAQSMLLGAVEMGLGGCMLLSINKDNLRKELGIQEHLEIVLVIALGVPKEKIILEDAKDGEIKYYRDDKQVHHVPKRPLDELIFNP
jgi:nitroreductase